MRKSRVMAFTAALVMMVCGISPANAAEASQGDSIDAIYENQIENGFFENGIDGWNTQDGTTITAEKNDTYGKSSGSAEISQSAKGKSYVYSGFTMRCNAYYRVSAKIKLAQKVSGLKGNLIISINDNGSISKKYALTDAASLSSEEWVSMEGYVTYNVSGLSKGFVSSEINKPAECYVEISGGSDNVSFYLDEVKVVRTNGTINKNFNMDNYSEGWSDFDNRHSMRDFNAAQEGVEQLVAAGEFPQVSRVVCVTDDGYSCTSPSQCVAIDPGVAYELSFWYKVTDGIEGGYMTVFTQHLYEGNTVKYAVSRAQKIETTGRWCHIRTVIEYPVGAVNIAGDIMLFIRISNPNTDFFVDGGVGRSFEIAEMSLTKNTNMIKNPYFSYSSLTGAYGSEFGSGIDTALTGWTTTGNNPGVLIYNTADIGSYDSSGIIGRVGLLGEGTTVGQNISVKAGKAYDISVWAKLGTDVTGEGVTGNLNIKVGSLRPANLSATTLSRDTWTRIVLENKVLSSTDSTAAVNLRINNASAGTVYFEGFDMEEILSDGETTTKIISVDMPDDFVIGKSSSTPVVSINSVAKYSMRYRYLVSASESGDDWTVAYGGHTAVGGSVPGLYTQLDWNSKYIKLELTPVNEYQFWGDSVESETMAVKGTFLVTDLTDAVFAANSEYRSQLEVKNVSGKTMAAVAILCYYNSDNTLNGITVKNQVLTPEQTEILTQSVILPENITGGYVKIYLWEGSVTPSGVLAKNPLMTEFTHSNK